MLSSWFTRRNTPPRLASARRIRYAEGLEGRRLRDICAAPHERFTVRVLHSTNQCRRISRTLPARQLTPKGCRSRPQLVSWLGITGERCFGPQVSRGRVSDVVQSVA